MNISINVEPFIDNLSYLCSDLCINMTFNDCDRITFSESNLRVFI